MKRLIDTIKNIWKIEELRKRIIYTLGLILIYRFGKFVVLPGVDAGKLSAQISNSAGKDLLNLINNFTGGAFSNASVFALGIMPYITASIIVQLLGFFVPYFQRLQMHEGESGRKKLNQITRILTIFITLVQGGGYLTMIKAQEAISPSVNAGIFLFSSIITLSAGTIFAMWLGEKITDRGIGNGISMLIMIGIIAQLPQALVFELTSRLQAGGILLFVLELAAFFMIVLATILIVQGVRKIPIQFAKRMVGRGAINMPVSGNRDYIPIKVNAAGVMPIIFAQAIMFLPATLITWTFGGNSDLATSNFMQQLTNPYSVLSAVLSFLLVVVFTFVYTALIVNPKQYADYLKRQNAFIPGVKPGSDTEHFIDEITTRVTLPGSIMLGLITIIPTIAYGFGISQNFAQFFGGTSLLILVAVILDTLQQIESYLLMRKYDGLVKEGRIKGRGGQGVQQIGAGM